jgi:hypothetical protein
MVSWHQTVVPALVFYALASVIAMGVAAMIAGLASLLGKLEARGKKEAK